MNRYDYVIGEVGTCPVCEKIFVIRKDGTLRRHLGDVRTGRFREVCAGVGQKPRETS